MCVCGGGGGQSFIFHHGGRGGQKSKKGIDGGRGLGRISFLSNL